MAVSLIHLKRLPHPFRARYGIVKIYIAFIFACFFKRKPYFFICSDHKIVNNLIRLGFPASTTV